jgi:hypothetical protein
MSRELPHTRKFEPWSPAQGRPDKRAQLDQVASEMRQRHSRVVKIRATVLARRGDGPHYPKQNHDKGRL